MTARRPTPKATPENTPANRALHYVTLALLVVTIVVVAILFL